MHCRRLCAAVLSVLVLAVPAFAQSRAMYRGLEAGRATRADVERVLGPGQPSPDGRARYRAPANDSEIREVLVTYRTAVPAVVERIDAYFTMPRPATVIHQQLGLPVATRARVPAGREEFFFPALQGAIFDGAGDSAQALAFSYVTAGEIARACAEEALRSLQDDHADAAKAAADRAVLIAPDEGVGQVALARYLMARQQYDEAIALLTPSEKWPARQQYEAFAWLGSLYGDTKKDVAKGRAAFAKALSLAPPAQVAEARTLFGRFLQRQGAAAEAVAEFEKALTADAGYAPARHPLADSAYVSRDFAGALKHYEALYRAGGPPSGRGDETRALVMWRYAYCLGQTGKLDESIAALWQFMARAGMDESSLNEVGALSERANRPLDAIDAYRLNYADRPTASGAVNLSRASLAAGKMTDARDYSQAALRLDPTLKNNAAFQQLLAKIK